MTEPTDPPRLVDAESLASARVRAVIEKSREDVGTERELMELDARLAPLLWPGGAVGAKSGTVTAARKAAIVAAAKFGATAGIVAGAFGLWNAVGRERAPQPRAPSVSASGSAASARWAAPLAIAPPPEPEPRAAEAPDGSSPAPFASAHVPTSTRPKSALSEADLLGQAQSALANDPARAFSLAEQHRRDFPRGILVQEREVIAIEALTRLGRTTQARARAARFFRTFPNSAHGNRIESLVGPT